MIDGVFFVYSTDDTLGAHYMAQRTGFANPSGSNPYSDHFLAVGDMDLDQKAEIVVVKNVYIRDRNETQKFTIAVFSIDSALTTFTRKAQRLLEEQTPDGTEGLIRHYAIALGDFDGDRVRLGFPLHYLKTGVMQPTIVVNTPPIHYDMLGGTPYDLSGCYPAFSCGFSSTYIQTSSFDTTITNEIHSDWGASETVTGGLSKGPVLKGKLKGSYGEKFSLKENSSTSYTISTGRLAAGDDWLFANVFDIDFYEYPVFDSLNPTPVGFFVVATPGPPRSLWIESKDDELLGNQFGPNHEVGNILSYPQINTRDTARLVVDFQEQTIGSTGSSFVSLQISSFQDRGVETSWDAGVEVGVTVGANLEGDLIGGGYEVELSGHYNYGELSVQTVKVGRTLEVRGDLGHLQPSFGTSGTYYVKPYAYWNRTGALVLDYKVGTLPSGPGSFWETRYGGKSDLALSLPWRYDPEKGFPLPGNDPSYRQRSRDIFVSRSDPRNGDSILISLRVRNTGLQNIDSSVTVRFYKNNPAAGGTLIGETAIAGGIPARSVKSVSIPWVIPIADTLRNTRIYAVLDPADQLANEVHEDNNTGWAPLVSLGTLTDVRPTQDRPQQFALFQNYPNPFNPVTSIEYRVASREYVNLKVYDVLGREVATLVNEVKQPGTYTVTWDARQTDGGRAVSLATGVYYYRLTAQGFTDVKKVVLLK